MKIHRITLPLLALILLTSVTGAISQKKQSASKSLQKANQNPVTITLVRWPYT